MATLEGTRAARFELVTAAHHFILAVLPLRHPQSRQALAGFVERAADCGLSSPDRESVLLRLLGVLDPHSGGRLPSLVDRYFRLCHDLPDGLRRFERCVEDVIRHRGIGNPSVQQAIAIIHDCYADPHLPQADVAEIVGLTPSALCVAFRSQTGLTFTEYLRDVRLDHAATMLMESLQSVKEVWGAGGYNDAANFDHDFKQRFGMTPTQYRERAIRPAPAQAAETSPAPAVVPHGLPAGARRRVLIVDDDAGTRETLGTRLRLDGYAVGAVALGREALDSATRDDWDVVVLDFHLIDMDGLDCLRALRRRQHGLRPAVVLFTADWEVEDHAGEAHVLGATIVSKLCDFAEFERLLASLCAM